MTTQAKSVDDQLHASELEMCKRSFLFWLEFGHILEPPPGKGRIPFAIWDHLLDAIELLLGHRLISILKARQIGISWLLAAYALWTALYKEGAVVLLLSQGQAEAVVFLEKCRYINKELPDHLRGAVGTDSTTQMTFTNANSKLSALPSTENAGRSETATLVIQDEADYHQYIDLNYLAVKPTIDGGGQLIQVSTVNKKQMKSLFKSIYSGAPKNGYVKRFYGWMVRPSRDERWYARVKAEAQDTAEMSKELYMEQEYPATEEEALAPSRVLAAFDTDILKEMERDNIDPVERIGPINIYQKHSVGKRYSAGTDTAHGAGIDAGITAVLDVATGYVVADINDSVMAPEELAQWSVKMLERYESPVWAIEDNDWGILTIRKAQELGYRHLYEHKEDVAGWHTDSKTRFLLWGELIEAISDRLITIPSKAGLAEFTTVVRNPDKQARIEASAGNHDDYPMAVGIAWQMRKEAYRGRSQKVKSTRWGDQNPRHTIGVADATP